MPRLTATLEAFHVYGTRGTMNARILYRGQCVQYFDGPDLAPMLRAAKARGFSHWREGKTGRVRELPESVEAFMQARADGARRAHAEMLRTRYGVDLQPTEVADHV